jgi:hypothetical protein
VHSGNFIDTFSAEQQDAKTMQCKIFRIVFWDVLLCKIIVDNYFTRQYIPEDNSEHHTRRRENLKSQNVRYTCLWTIHNT